VSHLHECLILGGGAAGLNAALVLGRARRDVVLLDAGRQSNLPAHAIGGLIAQEGTSPAALFAAAHAQLEGYPSVRTQPGEATEIERLGDGTFWARLADGRELRARRILLATGMDYATPDLPGIAERWGDAVFHCPFCHGWEVRDQALAVLGDGETGTFKALLLRGWSDDVVLVGGGFEDVDRAKLDAARIPIDERSVVAVRGEGATLVFSDGSELPRDGLLVAAPLRQRGSLAANLGVELDPPGTIAVDEFGRTSVAGVFAAGDVAGTIQMVAAALGDGGRTGAFVHMSLLAEEHDLAFPPGATRSGRERAAAAR
jgi:thioredoxin reductase